MAAVTICSDFGAQKNKVWHCFHCFPIYFPWSDGAFYLMLFFCPGFRSGHLMTLSSRVSLGFPGWWLFRKLSLFLMALTPLGSSGQVFCSSVWICLPFSSHVAWAYGFLWGGSQRWSAQSHHFVHRGHFSIQSIWLITVDADLDPLAQVVSSSISLAAFVWFWFSQILILILCDFDFRFATEPWEVVSSFNSVVFMAELDRVASLRGFCE